MKKNVYRCLSLCRLFFCLLFITTIHAMPIDTTPDIQFDIKKANQQFDQINLKLSVENLSLPDLEYAVEVLSNLNHQAQTCISDTQNKINELNGLAMQNASISGPEKLRVDQIYLDTQKKGLDSQQAECRLFSIRAQEAIDAYKTAGSQLVQKVAFTRESPLWVNMKTLMQDSPTTHLNTHALDMLLASAPSAQSSITMAVISLFLSFFLLRQLKKRQSFHHALRAPLLQALYIVLLTSILTTASLWGHQFVQIHPQSTNVPTINLTTLLLAYLSAIFLVVLMFSTRALTGFLLRHRLQKKIFFSIFIAILSLYVINIVGAMVLPSLSINHAILQLCKSIYLFTVIGLSLFFIHRLLYAAHQRAFIKRFRGRLYVLVTIWFMFCAILDLEGYQLLANHFVLSTLSIFAISFITILLAIWVQIIYLYCKQPSKLHTWILKYLGYKPDQILIEFLMLKTIAQILIVATGIYCIGESLDFATYYVEQLYSQLFNGIHFATFIIYPLRILTGIVIFCLLFLICRSISTSIIRPHQLENEEETQVAFASILTYIGFTLALIAGLMVAGFNFTGLALIAGALSLGIGLGLQSIVNNFVSGLILLIEKPIRPGDRISVDGVEGFVKKIRIRSTQIITPRREDVIIPNSELITHRVTNFMFTDKNCNICCEVGVAYGSDTLLVRDILLNIANLNDDVIKSGRLKPFVLFSAFGESNLVFQLWCLIKDVNKKLIVQSDLHFTIDAAFREHQISMAYPQRDIHLTWTNLK
jgi:potassium efflux system protein